MISEEDLDNRFSHHAPATDARRDAHTDVRRQCRHLADVIDHLVPDGREKALAVTKLEEVMFWANAGLARSDDNG
jgi:hypothetical protein